MMIYWIKLNCSTGNKLQINSRAHMIPLLLVVLLLLRLLLLLLFVSSGILNCANKVDSNFNKLLNNCIYAMCMRLPACVYART